MNYMFISERDQVTKDWFSRLEALQNALVFTALEDSTIAMVHMASTSTQSSTWGISLEYSLDNKAFEEWNGYSINVPKGHFVKICALNPNQTISYESDGDSAGFYKFVMAGKLAASGSIQALLDSKLSRCDVPASCFRYLFNGCTALVSAPELPASNLSSSSYANMFQNSGISAIPELSVAVIPDYAYSYMFSGCNSLKTINFDNQLSLGTVGQYGCQYMFYGCNSLLKSPSLSLGTVGPYGCSQMFRGCNSLSSANDVYADQLSNAGLYGLFYTCANLKQATTLSVGKLTGGSNCMRAFYNCTSLTSAPALPATTLVDQCYYGMFYNCTALTQAPALPATALAKNCYGSMFLNCVNLTSAPDLLATGLAEDSYSYMFKNCTSLSSPPTISATSLGTACCYQMFSDCTSLTSAPTLPATSLGYACYSNMFENCTSLQTVPSLPATSFSTRCYYNMFRNCTSLTSAILLPATSIPNYSDNNTYSEMFYGCKKINTISANFYPPWNISAATNNWLNGVSSSGDFYCQQILSDTYLTSTSSFGSSTVPAGWTVHTRDDRPTPLYFEALEANSTITLNKYKNPSGISLVYSSDGLTWNTFAVGTTYTIANAGDRFYLKSTGSTDFSTSYGYYYFVMTGKVSVIGSINYLTQQYGLAQSMTNYKYQNLFADCSAIVNVSGLELPTTTLASACYYRMFYNCPSLTAAPELPATTLASYCYEYMFYNCTSLIKPPSIIPAKNLPLESCYEMFYKCTSLTSIPDFSATTVDQRGCYGTFISCTSLVSATALPATTLATYCYSDMFGECTSLTSAPALPATTLANGCYYRMFGGCTALTSAPALPATTLAGYCYKLMFNRCTSLTSAPALPATTLVDQCYYGMFYKCTSLMSVPVLSATTLATYSYHTMFQDCTSLKISENGTSGNIVLSLSAGTSQPTEWNYSTFVNTGGTFKGSPSVGKTYRCYS